MGPEGSSRVLKGLYGGPEVSPRGPWGSLGTSLPAPYACTECGQASGRQGALHRHYIQHARGEL